MKFFDEGQRARNFEYGIARAVEAILASPQFLFRLDLRRRERWPVSRID